MLSRLPGSKVGMTQIFDEHHRVVPVTVIDISGWYVTQCKTVDRDGYAALQVGQLRKKYRGSSITHDWWKDKKRYFCNMREIPLETEESLHSFKVGQLITPDLAVLESGVIVDVTGVSTGKGFQGAVKRWGFAGGPRTHGSKFHRAPGSVGNMTSQGNVIKGKKMPGHCGHRRVTVRGLRVVRLDKEFGFLFVRGAVPGRKGSSIMVRKQG